MQPCSNNGKDTHCLKRKFKGLKDFEDGWDQATMNYIALVHRSKKNMKKCGFFKKKRVQIL